MELRPALIIFALLAAPAGAAARTEPVSAAAPAQGFDLRNIESATDPSARDKTKASAGALDHYLISSGFRNPVGRYVSSDVWDELLPIIRDDATLRVAKSLITAARHDDDAKALASVLAAYRDGADEEPVFIPSSGPTISVGNGTERVQDRQSERKQERRPLPPALPVPLPSSSPGGDNSNDSPQADDGHPKPIAADVNPRLGARIVANLAIFRSCSGALIQYLDHLAIQDGKTAAWGRIIRRSMGVAALPPDDSCL